MSRISHIAAAVLVSCALLPASLSAQGKPGGGQEPGMGAPVGLRLQVVISRYQGEKRISSMPYTLQLIANERETTNLRLGMDVPIAQSGGGFNYRPIGTNIDCRALSAGDGAYSVHITVEDRSVRFDQKDAASSAANAPPGVRNFTANFRILLRDGQTAQYTSAAEPATGEVVKIDATLNVLK